LEAARDPTGKGLADFFERQVRLLVKAGIQLRQGLTREGGLSASSPSPWGNGSLPLSAVK
jgi:hypothetical protein